VSATRTPARPVGSARPTVPSPPRRRLGRRQWVGLALTVLVLACVVAGAAVVAVRTSVLGVRTVAVSGGSAGLDAQVAAVVAVPLGTPLLRVDTSAVAARVAALPTVSSVVVTRGYPHTLNVRVTPRQVVAAVQTSTGYALLALDGRTVGTVPTLARVPAWVVMLATPLGGTSVSAATRAQALAVAAELPPPLVARVAYIQAGDPEAVQLVLRSHAVVRWGDASQGALKARVLAALLRMSGTVYDVTAPLNPAVR